MAKSKILVATLYFKNGKEESVDLVSPKKYHWRDYAKEVIEKNVKESLKYGIPFKFKDTLTMGFLKEIVEYDIKDITKIVINKYTMVFKDKYVINIDEQFKQEAEKERKKEYYEDNFREIGIYIQFDKYIKNIYGSYEWDEFTVNTLIPEDMTDTEFIQSIRKSGFLKIINKENDYKEIVKFIDIRKVKTIEIREPKPKKEENNIGY